MHFLKINLVILEELRHKLLFVKSYTYKQNVLSNNSFLIRIIYNKPYILIWNIVKLKAI